MTQIPSTLLEPPAPAPHAKEPPGSAPPDTPFAALLDDHQARTAVAEGHERAPVDPDGGSAEERGGDDKAPPVKPGAPDAAALAALLGGVPLAADVAVTVTPVAPAADAAAGSAEPVPLGGRVLSPGEAFREQARGIVLTRATRPIGVPADATALPLRPPVSADVAAPAVPATTSFPSLPMGLDVAAAEGRGDGLGAAGAVPAAPAIAARATRLADVLQAAARPAVVAAADEPAATPSPATVAGAANAASDAPRANGAGAWAPAAGPTAPVVAPASGPAPQAAAPAQPLAAPARGVGLEHAVETVRLALRAGAERGVSHARISLTPRELGTIEIHLRQTTDGLVARVVAEHGSAVQQLQQAGADLRRQLEQSGITVLRLDIGASGEQGGRAADRQAFAEAFGDDGREGRGPRGGGDPDAAGALDATDSTTSTTTLTLPNGALVDVLA
jgi:hypothetical protein